MKYIIIKGIICIYNDEKTIDFYKNHMLYKKDYLNISINEIIHSFGKKIKEELKNNIISSINHCSNVILDNGIMKGGYICDVIKLKLIINDLNNESKELNCVFKKQNDKESILSFMANQLQLYSNEYYFYESIYPFVKNVCIPKFYGIIKDNSFNSIGILLEDINTKDYHLNLGIQYFHFINRKLGIYSINTIFIILI